MLPDPETRELYSWTTEEQIAELVAGGEVLSRSERPGRGPGYAYDALAEASEQAFGTEAGQLAGILSSEPFQKARFAWPNSWAARMGWPGESYGNRLLRIVLRADAWIVQFVNGQFSAVNVSGENIPVSEVLLTPERIGAIYFQVDGNSCNQTCVRGTFTTTNCCPDPVPGPANGYREFIVNNPDMVEEWSFGTEQIRSRLLADIGLLTEFLARTREQPALLSADEWNARVTCCEWKVATGGELSAYENAVAIPSEYYLPQPARMLSLIETLEGDVFDPDPLVWRNPVVGFDPADAGTAVDVGRSSSQSDAGAGDTDAGSSFGPDTTLNIASEDSNATASTPSPTPTTGDER